jgi:arylsulfatase A-like enzyme
MKHFLAVAGLLLASQALPDADAQAPARPNIIVILSDDMGSADIGVHGCQDIPTPNIDGIAKRGVRFTTAYSNGSFCTPTRAALLSGRYQQRLGQEDLTSVSGPMPLQAKTLADRLRAAGYSTWMVGKWHLGSTERFTPLDRGFDHFFGFYGGGHFYLPEANQKGEYAASIWRDREAVREARYLTDAFGEEAAAFVERQRGASQPFFLYLAFNAVHTPIQVTEKYLQRFAAIEDRRRRNYAAMLSAMDDAIGLVTTKLAQIGKLDSTLVVFSNDNGGPTTRNAVNGSSNAPLRGSKCETFEGGIRVPLLMQWPGVIEPGTVYSQPAISMDITATAGAAAGADAAEMEGVNLLPYLSGQKRDPPHETLYWRCRTRSNNFAARQGNWKFVHSTEGAEMPGPQQKPAKNMLFNLASDPSEQHDLAAQYPEKLAGLIKLYKAWSAEVDADCRKLGIEPPQAQTEPTAKTKTGKGKK